MMMMMMVNLWNPKPCFVLVVFVWSVAVFRECSGVCASLSLSIIS